MADRVILPTLPDYDVWQGFLRIVNGVYDSKFVTMCRKLLDDTSLSVDWRVNPVEWDIQKLDTDFQEFASRVWSEWAGQLDIHSVDSGQMETMQGFSLELELLEVVDDIYVLTRDGIGFAKNCEESLLKIDEYEGILFTLGAVVNSDSCNLLELLSDFMVFFNQVSIDRYMETEATIEPVLRKRLAIMEKRKLIDSSGDEYEATDSGQKYLKRCHSVNSQNFTFELLQQMQDVFVRRKLAKYLPKMDPNKFEKLIKQLLQKMGYKGVQVTGQTRDGGIDVVADLESGITRIRHVIQAKRQEAPVGIGVVDRLRGSLHRGGAGLQPVGTIITTSNFTKGARDAAVEKNDAPITLIDGETLLDLLVEQGFKVKKGI